MKCIACHRELKDPKAIAEGIGPVCKLKNRDSGTNGADIQLPKVKLVFKSWEGARSWLIFSSPRHLLRATPIDEQVTSYVCDHGQCQDVTHVTAVQNAELEIEAQHQARLAAYAA